VKKWMKDAGGEVIQRAHAALRYGYLVVTCNRQFCLFANEKLRLYTLLPLNIPLREHIIRAFHSLRQPPMKATPFGLTSHPRRLNSVNRLRWDNNTLKF